MSHVRIPSVESTIKPVHCIGKSPSLPAFLGLGKG